jgi:DHA2 family multidrug resistance protein
MTIGILTTAAAMYHMTSFDAQVPFKTVMWARVYQAMALPLFFVPLNTIAYSDLPPGKSNNASALLNLCRNLGGGIGISAATTILDRRSQFHFSVLSAHFNNFDLPFRHQLKLMTSQFSGGGLNTSQAMHQAMAVMRSEAQTQALLLSYLDVFKIMSIGCVIVALLVLMTKRIRPGQHVEAPAH